MSEQEPQRPQKPIDDETLWGEPGRTAQESEEAVLPAEIDDAEAETEIIQDNENDEQKTDTDQDQEKNHSI